MELENDAGPNSAIAQLVAALNAATAPGTYAFVDTGIVGTDAIKVALLYQPSVVTPVGSFAVLDTSVDPRFLDTKNRPAIAQTFAAVSDGARVTVVVNHLKSKGSDCNDVGDPTPATAPATATSPGRMPPRHWWTGWPPTRRVPATPTC